MKILQYVLLISSITVFNFSCKKFLDVSSSNQIHEEHIFKEAEGIRIGVNGVYRLLSSTDLYGQNLTWGFISALGYNYSYYSLPYQMRDAASFDWQSSTTQQWPEQIWKRSFNTIANCNNIIQQVQAKDTSFFEQGSNEKSMILGEMYGIRALLHFDMLRLFSPAPASGNTAVTIPYVTTYPEYQPQQLPMTEIFKKITEDMLKAQSLLAPVDTIFLRDVLRNSSNRIRNNLTPNFQLPAGDFFNFRGERMNFFGATALLARIYLYMNDYEKAMAQSQVIYSFKKRNWFQWTNAFFQGMISDVDYIHTKRPNELLLCFSNSKNYDIWDAATLNNGYSQFYKIRPDYMNALFGSDLDDFRLIGWYNRYNDQRYITWVRPKGTESEAPTVAANQGPLVPIIRMSEMFHIIAECNLAKEDVASAISILNEVRIARGAKAKIPAGTAKEQVFEILVNDMIRETLTEGQTFFMYKRLNLNLFDGATSRVMQPSEWYAPLPASETDYHL